MVSGKNLMFLVEVKGHLGSLGSKLENLNNTVSQVRKGGSSSNLVCRCVMVEGRRSTKQNARIWIPPVHNMISCMITSLQKIISCIMTSLKTCNPYLLIVSNLMPVILVWQCETLQNKTRKSESHPVHNMISCMITSLQKMISCIMTSLKTCKPYVLIASNLMSVRHVWQVWDLTKQNARIRIPPSP